MGRQNITDAMKDEIGRECVNCHATTDLMYHHIVPLSMGGADTISNMVCLCGACHDLIHYGKSSAIDHAKAIKDGMKTAKAQGVHFGKKPADYEHIMETIAVNSTQFNPLSMMTEGEIRDMLGIGMTLYCRCKRELIKAMRADVWPFSFSRPRYSAKRPMYDHVIRDIRGY